MLYSKPTSVSAVSNLTADKSLPKASLRLVTNTPLPPPPYSMPNAHEPKMFSFFWLSFVGSRGNAPLFCTSTAPSRSIVTMLSRAAPAASLACSLVSISNFLGNSVFQINAPYGTKTAVASIAITSTTATIGVATFFAETSHETTLRTAVGCAASSVLRCSRVSCFHCLVRSVALLLCSRVMFIRPNNHTTR